MAVNNIEFQEAGNFTEDLKFKKSYRRNSKQSEEFRKSARGGERHRIEKIGEAL